MTEPNPDYPNRRRRGLMLAVATLLFLVVGIAFAAYYLLVMSYEETTDNAYVGGNLVTLGALVSGNVKEIRADETQQVQAGAPLISLDTEDAELALRQAQARLASTVLQLRERHASVAQFEAVIQQRKVALQKAEDDLARRAPLAADNTVSAEDVAHARQAVQDARAELDVAVKQARTAQSGLGGVKPADHPLVIAAREDYVQAWLALQRNSVLAPVTGYVARRSVQVGGHVTPGQSLMSIVPLDQLWIDANFKESELRNIRVGQPVRVEADLYGSKVVYHGKVLGLAAGTGSAFSLLPAQNATGNWVKVVQRLPVRVALDPKELAEHPLRIGLSTEVTVDTHQRDGTVLGAAMPATPVYSTDSLSQPTQQAQALAQQIIDRALAN